MVRRVTSSGSITIPVAMRRELGIKFGDYYDVTVTENGLALEAMHRKCIFCGALDCDVTLKNFKDKLVCTKCAEEIK